MIGGRFVSAAAGSGRAADDSGTQAAYDRRIIAKRHAPARRWKGVAAIIVLQIAALWMLNAACYEIAARTHLAIPGNVLGLVALYALLMAKVVPIRWFEASSKLLVKHLAFFFVPIAVGLMDAGGLLAHDGIAIVSTLVVSGAAGLLLAGFVSQRFEKSDRIARVSVELAP